MRLTGAPCTSTLMGLGAYPASDPQFLGMLGMHGTVRSQPGHARLRRHAQRRCPLRRPGDRPAQRLRPDAQKIHVDIDPSSINKNVAVDVPVVGDAGLALQAMTDAWQADPRPQDRTALAAWWRQIEEWRGSDCMGYQQDMAPDAVIKPQHALRRLHAACAGRDTFIATEVGQHQMWAAQHFGFEQPNRWMTSGGLGTMGYGLPAAMGVQVAHPDALCIDVAGEASILMNIQEMATLAQYRLPVKVFILNNRYLGMVRQWQELLHGSRYSESYSEALPDFVKLAEAFHATGLRAENLGELDGVIERMLATPGPVIADICVDEKENVLPDDPVGRRA